MITKEELKEKILNGTYSVNGELKITLKNKEDLTSEKLDSFYSLEIIKEISRNIETILNEEIVLKDDKTKLLSSLEVLRKETIKNENLIPFLEHILTEFENNENVLIFAKHNIALGESGKSEIIKKNMNNLNDYTVKHEKNIYEKYDVEDKIVKGFKIDEYAPILMIELSSNTLESKMIEEGILYYDKTNVISFATEDRVLELKEDRKLKNDYEKEIQRKTFEYSDPGLF